MLIKFAATNNSTPPYGATSFSPFRTPASRAPHAESSSHLGHPRPRSGAAHYPLPESQYNPSSHNLLKVASGSVQAAAASLGGVVPGNLPCNVNSVPGYYQAGYSTHVPGTNMQNYLGHTSQSQIRNQYLSESNKHNRAVGFPIAGPGGHLATPNHTTTNVTEVQNIPFQNLSVPQKYARILGDVDSAFAQYLRSDLGIRNENQGQASYMASGLQTAQSNFPLGILAYGTESSSDPWRHGLSRRHQVATAPIVDPTKDASIYEVIESADEYIAEICLAIKDVSNVIDNPGSTEINLVNSIGSDNPNDYTWADLDTTARHIMVALVHRCIIGSPQFKNLKAAKKVDANLTCSDRLEYVIEVLKKAKTVCRDVLAEDRWIALLVHEPISV